MSRETSPPTREELEPIGRLSDFPREDVAAVVASRAEPTYMKKQVAELQRHSNNLQSLLVAPEMGLTTWIQMVCGQIEAMHAITNGKEAKAMTPTDEGKAPDVYIAHCPHCGEPHTAPCPYRKPGNEDRRRACEVIHAGASHVNYQRRVGTDDVCGRVALALAEARSDERRKVVEELGGWLREHAPVLPYPLRDQLRAKLSSLRGPR